MSNFELSSSMSMLVVFFLSVVLAILQGTCIPTLKLEFTVGILNGLEVIYLGKRLTQKTQRFQNGQA